MNNLRAATYVVSSAAADGLETVRGYSRVGPVPDRAAAYPIA